jgi:hypothetical protein
MTKLVVQTYKAPHQWRSHPPGIGDFVRGACHLFERLDGTGAELRIDVSQTEFAGLIEQDPAMFYTGDPAAIAAAGEHFEDDAPFERDLAALLQSNGGVLHVCSNMGAWNRVQLPDRTRHFMMRFYRFVPAIENAVTEATAGRDYRVVTIRCGDRFFDDPDAAVDPDTEQRISRIIESEILGAESTPLFVTSDSHQLRVLLRERYGLLTLPRRSQHGAFGHAEAVAADLCLLKRSRFNYHINAWTDWWSGFSHYTSMIFRIPSSNFRSPRFEREDVRLG